MKLKPAHQHSLAALEAPLDLVLFGYSRGPDGKFYNEDGSPYEGVPKTVGGALGTAALVGGGLYAKKKIGAYANSPGVADRLSGLRMTKDGFAQRKPFVQKVLATGSRAVDDATGAIKTAGAALGKEAMYQGKGFVNAADSALKGLVKTARSRFRLSAAVKLKELAAKLPEVQLGK